MSISAVSICSVVQGVAGPDDALSALTTTYVCDVCPVPMLPKASVALQCYHINGESMKFLTSVVHMDAVFP